jgi:hypothetical protein
MNPEYRNGKYSIYKSGEMIIINTGKETYAMRARNLEASIPKQSLMEVRRLSKLN